MQWAGELAAALPTQTLAVMQERLVAEASTAAWQDYFLFNTGLALVGLLPALPCWRRQQYAPAAAPPPTPRAATSQGAPVSQAATPRALWPDAVRGVGGAHGGGPGA